MPRPARVALRRRTKTFTGCWTCRARKLKCDEGQPACNQCAIKGFFCEGYATRLQWLPPITGRVDDGSSSTAQLAPGIGSRRRQILIEPPRSILSSEEIDGILAAIDSHQFESIQPSERNEPFGVFQASSLQASPQIQGCLQASPPTSASEFQDDALRSENAASVEDPFLDSGLQSEIGESASLEVLASTAADVISLVAPGATDSRAGGFEATPNTSSDAREDGRPITWDDPSEHAGSLPLASFIEGSDDGAWNESPTFPPTVYGRHVMPGLSLNWPRQSFLPDEHRYLLHHYMHRVVKIFCVIDNTKSPWRTLHLPKALQSTGELGVGGSTTLIRGALLHALLSISAFALSNDHNLSGRGSEGQRWGSTALRLRCRAISLLKQAVDSDFYSSPNPKYKEFLATMLSMITIDVTSGDTSTCGVHLDGCEQLIRHMKNRKTKYSRKALSLHRTYFYLRTIHESTRLWIQDEQSCSPGLRQTCSIPGSVSPDSVSPTPTIKDESTWLEMGRYSSSDMTTCEFIYGVPQNLLILLRRAAEVVRMVYRSRTQHDEASIPPYLAELCDEIEQEILDWSAETKLAPFSKSCGEDSSKIIDHQTRAFHHALIIYFSQHIRRMHYRYLRPYVETVIESLEAIEEIKTDAQILAGPLFWPAFIAASEAFDDTLRQRFKAWFERTRMYGMEAARSGNEVTFELWKRPRSLGSRSTSHWRAVAEEKQSSLMLT
ncbi:fungal-specific transcription factor domain-containing protein [Lineolata rhizophorae]|uniref:Fungal-specific transcription factor domain-containing protein n=1 Tax=Lineolata rhizophorae TaxID=578093 RepID=A0A6A6NRV4_9PEZI|nr:fungal-specific transcription factor domain-containing protein [Lineolata rhizophorae]